MKLLCRILALLAIVAPIVFAFASRDPAWVIGGCFGVMFGILWLAAERFE